LADKLDALLWLVEEHRLGNTAVVRLKNNLYTKVMKAAEKMGVSGFVAVLINESSNPIEWFAE
jgi:hypothetical protein